MHIAALVLISLASHYKSYRMQNLPRTSERLPVLIVTAATKASGGDAERLAKNMRLLALDTKKKADRSTRDVRPGGLIRVEVKRPGKASTESVVIGTDMLRQADMASTREAIRGFLIDRLKFTREVAWEQRDLDPAFKIIPKPGS